MSIIKSIYFPDKTFASKEALFKALKDNEENIIDFKKSHIYKGIDKGGCLGNAHFKDDAVKGIGFTTKENHIYPIISTTKYFDTHMDVHFDGCFNKTASDQQGKVYYCADHQLTTMGIIAKKSDVKMFVKNIDWSFVGKEYAGQTQALIFEIDKAKISNKTALELIESESDLQNSIRMQYVKIQMGIDSKDKYYASNKAYYDSRINEIANKDVVEKHGYFFGVEALKIQSEGSMVIAGGSNDATAIYQGFTEAAKGTSSIIEPSQDTQKQIKIINSLKFY